MSNIPNREPDEERERHRSAHLGRKSAIYAVLATLVIVPIIMIISHLTVPDTDPMFKALTPMVGIIYTPISFCISWYIIYLVLKFDKFRRESS